MKRLFLNKALELIKQSKSFTKNRLNHIKTLNDLTKDNKDEDSHSTDFLFAKENYQQSQMNLSYQLSKKLRGQNVSFLKRMQNYIGQQSMLKLLLKNEKSNLGVDQRKKMDFLHKQLSQVLVQNQSSNSNEYSRMRWIRQLILILFLVKVLQHQNYHCDYDINDMMVTIELDERMMNQQQQNEKHLKEQKQKKAIKKQKKRTTIKMKGPTKDERYGTPQQMLRHQMDSSEDFGSVEQRMMFMQREMNKNKQALQSKGKTNQKNQTTRQQQKVEENNENLADVVFRQSKRSQVKVQRTENTQAENIGQMKPIQQLSSRSQQQKIKNQNMLHYQNGQSQAINNIVIAEQTSPSTNSQQETQHLHSIIISNEQVKQANQIITDQQKQSPKLTYDQTILLNKQDQIIKINNNQQAIPIIYQQKQNHATIHNPSQELTLLSKNIQNFLKLRGISVTVSNNKNQQATNSAIKQNNSIKLNLCNKLMDCKNIDIQKYQSQNRDVLHHINNFLNPPHIINTIEQAKQLLKTIQKDENIISSYIPQHTTYQPNKKSPSQYDTFSLRYSQSDPLTVQKQFRQYKYLSSSKKNCFVIVRDKQVANYLKVSTNKIGVPHVLYKYDKELNGKQSQPNCKIDGEFYHVVGNMDKMIEKQKLNTIDKVAQKINALTQRSFTLINSVQDMFDKIRQLKQQSVGFSFSQQNQSQKQKINKHKKLFVIKINDPKQQGEINTILQKLSKMNKSQVSIVKTQSEVLLKSLGIFSNEEYGTMRLFDLQHKQEPIVKQNRDYWNKGNFQRYIPNVPFQIEALSRWISNITPFDKPYEEYNRSVNKLKSSHPGDFQSSNQQGKVKLVLFYKQGCKGCKMMQDLLSKVVELKQRLKQGDNQIAKRITREICLKYHIEDPQHLRSIQISKFNILNDDQSIQVPQTTPTVYLYNGTNKQKVLLKTDQIFNHLNKINTNNGEIVQDHMVRDLIQEIEKGSDRLEVVC